MTYHPGLEYEKEFERVTTIVCEAGGTRRWGFLYDDNHVVWWPDNELPKGWTLVGEETSPAAAHNYHKAADALEQAKITLAQAILFCRTLHPEVALEELAELKRFHKRAKRLILQGMGEG